MLGVLLIIAAICLIILNPFQGAAVIGAVTVGVVLLFMLIGLVAFAGAKKHMDKSMRDFHDRHF